MRKNWFRWALYPILITFLIWAVLTSIVIPRAEEWVKSNVERLSGESTPFVITLEDFQIDFSSASLVIEGLKLVPKEDFAKFLKPITIASVHVNVDTFQLLTQRLQVRAVFVNDLQVDIDLDPLMENPSKPKKLPVRELLETLNNLPIDRVYLMNPTIKLSSKKQQASGVISGRMLSLRQEKFQLTLKSDLENITAKFKDSEVKILVRTTALLTPDKLDLLHSEIKTEGLQLRGKAQVIRVEDLMLGAPLTYSMQANVSLPELQKQLVENFKLKVPDITGTVESQVMGEWTKEKGFKASLDLKTQAVKVAAFEIGQAQLKGELDTDRLFLDELQLKHTAGQASLIQSSLQLHEPYQFAGTINLEQMNLQKLFVSMQLKNIPVDINAKGRVPCSGTLVPIEVNCYGDLEGTDIWVGSSMNKDSTIVALDKVNAKGKFNLNTEKIDFESQLNIGENWGKTSGVVIFKEGFNINFDTKELDISNVKSLLGLKWRGKTSIEGFTKGDSNAAITQIKFSTTGFALEDYFFDRLTTTLGYDDGTISLTETDFTVDNLHAQGNLAIALGGKGTTIQGAFKLPQLGLAGVRKLVEKKIPLPTRMEGRGQGEVSFKGPLDVWKMDLDFKGDMIDVVVGPESFGNLHAEVKSEAGNMNFNNVQFSKGNSKITVQGQIANTQQFNLKVDGQQWRLEETELLSKVGVSLLGNLNFTGEVTGALTDPVFQARGNVSETVLADQEVPNSFFNLLTTKDHLQGSANVFGNKIQGDIDIPFDKVRPLKVRVKTLDWNFAQLLAILSGNLQPNEFDSRLTMELDLKSDSGKWDNLNGSLKAPVFMLRRSQTSLQNTQPIVVDFRSGLINIKSFILQGPDQTGIKLDGENFRFDNLNLKMKAAFDLRILHLFLPFLDDLGGPFELSAQLRGNLAHPQLLGSASIKDAFIKLRGFPHPFEQLSSQITFSQNTVLLQDLKGEIAGGELTGGGRILINGIRDFPMNLRFRLENAQLNVPEKIKTIGTADITLTGNWFPFVLGGEYVVRSGLFEKELSGSSGGLTPRQSQFLPKVVKENRSEPILLDLKIDFTQGISVKNSLIDGSATGNLNVKGPPDAPGITGRVYAVRGSKVIFKDKIFDVQNGVITFSNPDEINPDVYLIATSRVNEYDITLLVQGPGKTANVRLSSVPPLPEPEIVSLLALGITSSQLEKNIQAGEQTRQAQGEVFGAVVSQTFGKGFQNALGVNLQVTSSFDTIKNVSVPKMTLSKQLNTRTNAQVSRPLSGSRTTEFKLQYKLNQDLSVIGSYEARSAEEDTTAVQSNERNNSSVFGLDLEFRKEFK
ncbi:MAG: translocation/assembly module TamB [Bdellovibrionota bacterium]